MEFRKVKTQLSFKPWRVSATVILISLLVVSSALAAHAVGGADVKVTHDNNNVDGGTPNPSFDAQNRPEGHWPDDAPGNLGTPPKVPTSPATGTMWPERATKG